MSNFSIFALIAFTVCAFTILSATHNRTIPLPIPIGEDADFVKFKSELLFRFFLTFYLFLPEK